MGSWSGRSWYVSGLGSCRPCQCGRDVSHGTPQWISPPPPQLWKPTPLASWAIVSHAAVLYQGGGKKLELEDDPWTPRGKCITGLKTKRHSVVLEVGPFWGQKVLPHIDPYTHISSVQSFSRHDLFFKRQTSTGLWTSAFKISSNLDKAFKSFPQTLVKSTALSRTFTKLVPISEAIPNLRVCEFWFLWNYLRNFAPKILVSQNVISRDVPWRFLFLVSGSPPISFRGFCKRIPIFLHRFDQGCHVYPDPTVYRRAHTIYASAVSPSAVVPGPRVVLGPQVKGCPVLIRLMYPTPIFAYLFLFRLSQFVCWEKNKFPKKKKCLISGFWLQTREEISF